MSYNTDRDNPISKKGQLYFKRKKDSSEYLFLHDGENGDFDFCVHFTNLQSDYPTLYKLERVEIQTLESFSNDLFENESNSDFKKERSEDNPVWEKMKVFECLVPSKWRQIIEELEDKVKNCNK